MWLFAPDVTDDALNDPASYTAASGKPAVLTVGDVNGDGVINAQDALAIRTACAGETTPAANVLHIHSLPANLREATLAMSESDFMKEAVGSHIFERYTSAKMDEWNEYTRQVTDWEISNYLYKV